jgi:hypothetical protein
MLSVQSDCGQRGSMGPSPGQRLISRYKRKGLFTLSPVHPSSTSHMSRPSSPLKKTFQRWLSPSKTKAATAGDVPAPPPPFALHDSNWTREGQASLSSSSSSSSTSSSCAQGAGNPYAGWNVAASYAHNKENINHRSKTILDQVMAAPAPQPQAKTTKQDADLDTQFEELMVCPCRAPQ